MSDELRSAAERLQETLDGDDPREWIDLDDIRAVMRAVQQLTAPLPADLDAELMAVAESVGDMYGGCHSRPHIHVLMDAIRPLLHRAAGVRADDGELKAALLRFAFTMTAADGKGPCFCKCHEDDYRPHFHSDKCIQARAELGVPLNEKEPS